ncbi:hypothetical protein EV359DRAFT_50549, partial [Lentinula novae-zelandiae]
PVGSELPKDLQLDRDHTTRLGDKNYDDPLKLFYGCGVNVQDFLDYHQRHNLLRPPPMHSRPALWKYMTDQVLEDLREHCEFDLFRLVLAMSAESYTLAIYDSYLIDRTKMR